MALKRSVGQMPTVTLLFKTSVGLPLAICLDLPSLLPFQLTTSKTRNIFLSLLKCFEICCKVQMTLEKTIQKSGTDYFILLKSLQKDRPTTCHILSLLQFASQNVS